MQYTQEKNKRGLRDITDKGNLTYLVRVTKEKRHRQAAHLKKEY